MSQPPIHIGGRANEQEWSEKYGARKRIPVSQEKGQPFGIFGATMFDAEADPHLWTIACTIDLPQSSIASWGSTATLGRVLELVGIVEFGSGANQNVLEFDFVSGVQITLPAKSLKVSCIIPVEWPTSVPKDTFASVTVGRGATGLGGRATRSVFLFNLVAPVTRFVRVPPFARAFNYTAPGLVDPAITLNVRTGPGVTDGVLYTVQAAALQDPLYRSQGSLLFGPARWIEIVSPNPIDQGSLVFILDV